MSVYRNKCMTVQVVDAEKRGDACYANKRGWYWHQLDDQMGIVDGSLTGPFTSESEARESAFAASE